MRPHVQQAPWLLVLIGLLVFVSTIDCVRHSGNYDDSGRGRRQRPSRLKEPLLGMGWETSCGRAPARASQRQLSRIINGYRVVLGEFPSYVRVLVEKGEKIGDCGGTLVSDRHVLTAAHCLVNRTGKIELRFGSQYLNFIGRHEVSMTATDSICYDRWLYTRLQYDWVLLTLERPIVFNDYIQPACLPRSNPSPSTFGPRSQCYLVGLGARGLSNYNTRYEEDNFMDSQYLQKVRVGQSDCGGTEAFIPSSDPSRTCYMRLDEPVGGPHSCYGDSGGPVLCKDVRGRWTLVASVSYGAPDLCGIRSQRGRTVHRVFADVIKLLPSIDRRCKRQLQQ